jgi:hypothetical protein
LPLFEDEPVTVLSPDAHGSETTHVPLSPLLGLNFHPGGGVAE